MLMDIETRFEKAIIQGDLNLVREFVYTGGIQVTRRHIKIAQTMKKLCESHRCSLIYDNVDDFLIQEYRPQPKLNWLQRLIGIHVDYSKMNL